jgi:hypothetical protein
MSTHAPTSTWSEQAPTPAFLDEWAAMGLPAPRIYRRGALVAFVSRDEVARNDYRWHVSLRYGVPGSNGRIPTWDELVDCAHELRPGVCFSIGIPPRSWWMNIHPHVLHLFETRDPHLIEQWRFEARGDTPT